ncbi:hypothetical protein HDU92_006004 [Lobulomyces angularis]|nr:hypothetical protein HDU92_006004 [Lobulomyces angularis]
MFLQTSRQKKANNTYNEVEGPEPDYNNAGFGFETFVIKEKYVLNHGGYLINPTIAYETWGTLNSDKSNVILLHTGLSASSHAKSNEKNSNKGWWQDFIGPGLAIDTSKFFVVCSNVLGSCFGSTGPSSINPETKEPYGGLFPIITISDMVRAQVRLLDNLGITKLYASVGASMGGMQSLCLAAMFPERVGRLISISAAARSHPSSIALRYMQRQVLMSDPNWNEGNYYSSSYPLQGMKLARQIATITYRSGPEWEKRFGRNRSKPNSSPTLDPDFLIETYLDHQGDNFIKNNKFDPNSMLYISKAMDLFDLSHRNSWLESSTYVKKYSDMSKYDEKDEFCLMQGCSTVNHPTLIFGIQSDVLFPVWQQKEISDVLKANGNKNVTYFESDSLYGHDTFLIDRVAVGGAIKGLVKKILTFN